MVYDVWSEYLGSIINNNGRSEKKIKVRVGQAKKAFLFKKMLLTLNNVDLRTRKRLVTNFCMKYNIIWQWNMDVE